MRYLLDVLSELGKRPPDAEVVACVNEQPAVDLFGSVLTVPQSSTAP
jgi:hypothetical protein